MMTKRMLPNFPEEEWLVQLLSICFSSSHSSPAQSLNVSMCSDVHDVEDGELDEVEVAEQERGDEAEADDDDAAMASPGGARVSDQGRENSLSISITNYQEKYRSLGKRQQERVQQS